MSVVSVFGVASPLIAFEGNAKSDGVKTAA